MQIILETERLLCGHGSPTMLRMRLPSGATVMQCDTLASRLEILMRRNGLWSVLLRHKSFTVSDLGSRGEGEWGDCRSLWFSL
jgi:hypothetical protein